MIFFNGPHFHNHKIDWKVYMVSYWSLFLDIESTLHSAEQNSHSKIILQQGVSHVYDKIIHNYLKDVTKVVNLFDNPWRWVRKERPSTLGDKLYFKTSSSFELASSKHRVQTEEGFPLQSNVPRLGAISIRSFTNKATGDLGFYRESLLCLNSMLDILHDSEQHLWQIFLSLFYASLDINNQRVVKPSYLCCSIFQGIIYDFDMCMGFILLAGNL